MIDMSSSRDMTATLNAASGRGPRRFEVCENDAESPVSNTQDPKNLLEACHASNLRRLPRKRILTKFQRS